MLKTCSWQVDWQLTYLHFVYEAGRKKQRAGFFIVLGLGSFAWQLLCLQLCNACGAFQNSSDCWWIMRHVLGGEKPRFLYVQSSLFSLSVSVSHSFIPITFLKLLRCARHSTGLVVQCNGEQKSSSNSSHGACSLATNIKSACCWSAPRSLAWNKLSINIRWLANRLTETYNEGKEHSAVRTQFMLSLTREHAVLPWAKEVHTLGISK